jgi:hypothetical protein
VIEGAEDIVERQGASERADIGRKRLLSDGWLDIS